MELINKTKLKMVLVSPLKRSLETALEVLKTYPEKEGLRIIAYPYITEVLQNANDI